VNRTAALMLLVATAVVLFGSPLWAAWAALIAVTAAWYLDPPAVRAGLRVGVVLAVVFAASVTAAVVAWAEGPERGLAVGGMVLLRLLVLTVAAAVLVRRVDAEALLRLTTRLGFERLGLVLGLALNALPRIAETSAEVWTAYSMRSRGLVDRLRRLPGLGEVLLAHTARVAEEAAAAASLRGHSALTRPRIDLPLPVRMVIVTGPTDGGKTGAVLALAERLQSRGVPVAGFVQLGERESGRKVGFRLRDIATGEEAGLAVLGERSEGDFGTRYRFLDEGFQLGRQALARVRPGGVVIVDELGPVELRGAGHMPAVQRAVKAPGIAGAVVVVRRPLVPALLAALEASDAVVIDVEEQEDHSVESILGALNVESYNVER
jgi:nucleoside-triphosphatase THEP1/energy-coupling factor transporter transmembrane protein EcfT